MTNKNSNAQFTGHITFLILIAVTILTVLVSLSCARKDLSSPDAGASEARAEEADTAASDTQKDAAATSDEEESWFLVTEFEGDRDYAVFVDTSTVDTIDGAVHSWSKLVFEEDQKDSDGLVYREVRIASAINCEKRTYKYLSSKFYDSLGKMVYMENVAADWSAIPGGTVSEHIANFVCGYQPPKGQKKNP